MAERVALERDALVLRAGRDFALEAGDGSRSFTVATPRARYEEIVLRPLGRFQRDNFALAIVAAEEFLGARLDPAAVRSTAAELALPGRLEVIARVRWSSSTEPTILRGAAALGPSLDDVAAGRRLIAVMSILDDKDAAAMLSSLLPLCEGVVFTRSSHRASVAAGHARKPCWTARRARARGRRGSCCRPRARSRTCGN